MVSAAAPVLAAQNQPPMGETAPPPTPEGFDPSELPGAKDIAAALEKAEREEEQQRAWLESPEAVQQREDSRLAYANLDGNAARELLRTTFAEQLAQLNADPARNLGDVQLISSSEETSATIKEGGESVLLESTLPVQTENEEGDLRKVDVGLEETPDGFETENALVDVQIPETVDEPIEVGEEGVAITLVDANESRLARPLGDENVFATDVLTDTDILVSPIAKGVEIFNILRSEDSPETLRYQVEMPAGAELRDSEWGAEVVREGETLAVIPEPEAIDAQGTIVPVELRVESHSLVLTVDHRDAEYAMPILLDPIMEDDSNWIYGQNHDALDLGVWSYWNAGSWWFHGSTYCIYECFGPGGTGTRGLYVSLEGQRYYGAQQFGQWAYSAPPYAHISSVTLGNPYVHADHNCSEAQYPEPHNYFGMWSVGSNSWTYFSVNSANQPGNTYTLFTRGDAAIFGLSTGPGIPWIPCWRDLYAGGAQVTMNDDYWPSASSVQDPPTYWINPSTPVHIVVQANDVGLGVQNVVINSEGAPPIYQDPVQNQCSGTRRKPCLTSRTAIFDVTGASFREGRRPAAVTAYDPTGKYSNAYHFETKVDGLAPDVTLNGQLAEATEEDKGAQKGAEKVEKLRLPVYNLKIEAKDGTPGSEEKYWQSGVKSIEVFLDGAKQEVPWQPATSCAQNCAMTQTYQLQLSKLQAPGPHKLKVTVRDFAGNPRDRDIEFEYFPATGMRDEYVMQYFPLPDGQGNEAEEGHPRGPELAVNVMNGNLVYRETDVDVEGAAALDLEVERYYNSMLPNSENTEWGDGWTLAQTPELDPIKAGGSQVPNEAEIVDESGLVEGGVSLPTVAGASKFDPTLQATLTKTAGGGYELNDDTGETPGSISFDPTGQAEALESEGYAKVDYEYEGGALSRIEVSDPATFGAKPSELEIPEPQLITAPLYASLFGSSGSGDGQLKSPADVAVEAQGNLWVVDKANNRVQKFDPNGKFLAKFGSLGSGNGQFNRPTAIAVAANGDLLITDGGNGRVQRFNSSGVFLSAFGAKGTGNGQFASGGPEGIALDAAGNIWVSDTYGGRLQKFSSAGTFLQAVGTKGSGTGQLGEPTGIDIAPSGDIWVADWQNNRISVFKASGEFLASYGAVGTGNGQFRNPDEVEIDTLGNVWVGDQTNSRIQQFDLSGQFKGKFGSSGSGAGQFSFSYPMGLAADSTGHLWIADVNNNRVQQWQVPIERPAYAGKFGSSGTGSGQLQAPADVTVGIEGNLWVVERSNNRIQQFDPSGKSLAKFGALGSADGQFNRPTAIAVDRDGNLLVADSNNSRIAKFSPDGKFLSKFGAPGTASGQFSSPEGVVADLEGNIWVADSGNGRIEKFDEEGKFLAAVGSKGSGSGQLGRPVGIDVDREGNIWVGDMQNNRVSVFESDGDFVRQFGSLGTGSGQFNHPSAVEIDAHDNVWVADDANQRVQRFDLDGNYIGRFGSAGSGDGQFSLPTANNTAGLATTSSGAIWVADVNNNRIQRWQLGNYQTPPSQPLDLNDGDAKVDVETSGGLVTEVVGNVAGANTYTHAGDDLTSHVGPEGNTKYEYDSLSRMTKVTLPNGTWGSISYLSDNRVASVTVKSASASEAKKTTFAYQDTPSRRTTVILSDAPHITYEIGNDGSVLKWWNTAKPPTIEPLTGNLYGNRETAAPISAGDYILTAHAWDAEGIASIDIIVDGNVVVDEWKCPLQQPLGCVSPIPVNEWVMETDGFSPGIHWIEVLVADQLGEHAAQRFWVNIPQPPPPSIGAPVPPKFKDIKSFREEYGLEVVFPVANEIELNERIFNLIGAWHNPNSPAGEVARASSERWGVPLRPADVAELEYREQLYSANADRIDQWVEQTNPGSFAGYYLDHRAGGIMYIGFLGDQAGQLSALASSLSLIGGSDRLKVYPTPPTVPYVAVRATTESVLSALESNPTLRNLVVNVEDDETGKATRVGTPNVAQVDGILDQMLGANAPVTVEYDSGGGGFLDGRYRNSGRMRAGDYINSDLHLVEGIRTGGVCTAGFGAEEEGHKPKGDKPNGEELVRSFLLTAGHCAAEIGEEVWRAEYDKDAVNEFSDAGKSEVGTVARTAFRLDEYGGVRTDGAAIRIKQGGIVPQGVWGWDGRVLPTEPAGRARKDDTVCYSGAVSKNVACGRIVARSLNYHPSGAQFGLAGYWVRFPEDGRPQHGDSGGPVWNLRTGASIGLVSGWRGDGLSETLVAPLLHPPNMPANRVPGILHQQSLAPLQLRLGG